MFRLLARLIGLISLVFAVITVVLDLTRSIANSTLTVTPLGQEWFNLSSGSLNLTQAVISRYVHPFLWDPVMQNILLMPGWLVFFVLAIMFFWLGRKRKRHWQERFGR